MSTVPPRRTCTLKVRSGPTSKSNKNGGAGGIVDKAERRHSHPAALLSAVHMIKVISLVKSCDRHKLIFIDETELNRHTNMRRGRSIRGQRAHAVEPNSAGNRLNVYAAVSPVSGMVKYDIIFSSHDKEAFSYCMQGSLMHPQLQNDSCMICLDTVSWHHHELVKEVMDAAAVRRRIVRHVNRCYLHCIRGEPQENFI